MTAASHLGQLSIIGVLVLAITACPGSDSVSPVPGVASVRLIHGINGTDLGAGQAFPLDLRLGQVCALATVPSGTVSAALALQAGTYEIAVSRADSPTLCGGSVVATAQVQVADGANVSFFVHLNAQGNARLTSFTNDLSATAAPRFVVRHGAATGALDVLLDDDPTITALTNAQEQTAQVPAGEYSLAVAGAEPLFEGALSVANGAVHVVYVIGTPDNNTVATLLQVLSMQ